MIRARLRGPVGTIAAMAVVACGGDGSTAVDVAPLACSISTSLIFDGGPGKDGIPALVDPPLARIGDPALGYLIDEDRVIGIDSPAGPVAVPLNVGWWHEIVNLELDGRSIAITHCPLTGSSLAFDRAPAGNAAFGVSGLLFRNNLMMYDRNRPESLWPQMSRAATCGTRDGTRLPMVAVVEMTWDGWRTLHPDTRVVVGTSERSRYRLYSYGAYDRVGNDQLLFPMDRVDRRRPLKERVLGIPDGTGGIAFPFGLLTETGAVAAIRTAAAGGAVVVLWDRQRAAAAAFRPSADGRDLDFEVRGLDIVDVQTGSRWSVDGRALDGPLAGQRLAPVAEAYVAFWFAWAAFQPSTTIWGVAAT